MARGFESVNVEHMQNTEPRIEEHAPNKREDGRFYGVVQLPTRSDARSAGYDFYAPRDITILPSQKVLVWSDVKAYMEPDEVLLTVPRSSMGIKKGLMLSNTLGVIDASYYENESNDGNIGFSLLNTSGKAITIKRGERFAQGIFTKFLVADMDDAQEGRTGGIGSSGK